MYAATPCDGRVDFDDKPTTAIVRHSSRILAIVSTLLMSKELRDSALPPDVRKGSAFPASELLFRGYASTLRRREAQPPNLKTSLTERRSLSAHQRAKPKTNSSTRRRADRVQILQRVNAELFLVHVRRQRFNQSLRASHRGHARHV